MQATPTEPRYSDRDRIPSHSFVIEPLLRAAVEVHLLDGGADADLCRLAESLGTRRGNGISLDVDRELLRGVERLWNASAGARGALVVACDRVKLDLPSVFHWCDGPWIWESEQQLLKGLTTKGLRCARDLAAQDRLVFAFSASNGTEWMDVLGNDAHLSEAYAAASEHCRHFKRFVEHKPGASDEIITDRPPYSTSV